MSFEGNTRLFGMGSDVNSRPFTSSLPRGDDWLMVLSQRGFTIFISSICFGFDVLILALYYFQFRKTHFIQNNSASLQ